MNIYEFISFDGHLIHVILSSLWVTIGLYKEITDTKWEWEAEISKKAFFQEKFEILEFQIKIPVTVFFFLWHGWRIVKAKLIEISGENAFLLYSTENNVNMYKFT